MRDGRFIRHCKFSAGLLALVGVSLPNPAAAASWVAAGTFHSVVVDDPHGITQAGRTGTINFTLPAGLASGPSWAVIATGNNHGLAIDGSGALFSWGNNDYGQLGRPMTSGERTAVRVGTSQDWRFVAAAGDRSAAIQSDGSLWTWGDWPTGIDGVNQSAVPLRVVSGDSWKAVGLGNHHSLAVREDGSLWAWGYNNHHSLGDGTNVSRPTPVRIGIDNDWASVACGGFTSYAIKTNGSLWVWGGAYHSSVYGMGPGVQIPLQVPTPTGTGNDWKSIHPAVDGRFVLALKRTRSLWSWGTNPGGVLGHGDATTRDTPAQVGTSTDWHAVAAGATHAIATRADGSVWHWGGLPMSQVPGSETPADVSALFSPVAGMRVFSEWSGELNHSSGRLTCRTTILGEPTGNLLRLRNDGLLPLIVSEIVVPAGFSISSPVATVPPLQEISLSLYLAASSKGAFGGDLLIRSNRHSIPEFAIEIIGQVVSADDDTDGDGLNDAAEAAMSQLGFDWDSPQHSMVEALITRRTIAGLSLAGDVQDVRIKTHPPQWDSHGALVGLEFLDSADGSTVPIDSAAPQAPADISADLRIQLQPGRRLLRIGEGK